MPSAILAISLLTWVSALAAQNMASAPIDFVIKDEATRYPTVKTEIAGREIVFLLDTAAGGIWINRRLANSLGLGSIEGPDLPPVTVRLGGWQGTVSHIHIGDQEDSDGISGSMNPAALLDHGSVVVDLAGKRLMFLEGEPSQAISRYPKHEFEELPLVKGILPQYGNRPQDYATIVRGALADFPEGPMLLDSGAPWCRFRDNYVHRQRGDTMGMVRIRLGHHEVTSTKADVGPHRKGSDVVVSLGVTALQDLIIGLPAQGGSILLGFPK